MSPLAPGILIAAPPMGDSNFERSVVLLASHDAEGAFGWVINGEAMLTIGELLEQAEIPAGKDVDYRPLESSVRVGGPVSEEQVWLVYPAEEALLGVSGQMEIAPGLYATASREFLEKLAQGGEVPNLRAFAGYAGWAKDQLEREIQEGAWLPGDVSLPLLFETGASEVWNRAYALQGVSPISFTAKTVGRA